MASAEWAVRDDTRIGVVTEGHDQNNVLNTRLDEDTDRATRADYWR